LVAFIGYQPDTNCGRLHSRGSACKVFNQLSDHRNSFCWPGGKIVFFVGLGMKCIAFPLSWRVRVIFLTLFVSVLLVSTASAQTQHKYPGRGAVSIQDVAKLISPAVAGTTAADQVCARYVTGSVVADPPVLQSQNGVLEVTMKFLTVTDSQGLVRYCYVTNTGLEAPTLVVNPGDNLIIHFQNDLPVPAASSSSDNMAGMKMALSNDATTSPIFISTERIFPQSAGRMKLFIRLFSRARVLITTCRFQPLRHRGFIGIIPIRTASPKVRYRAVPLAR
jgi:hypothetical protein